MHHTATQILRDETAVAEAAARLVVERAQHAIEFRGTFRLALAGGSTPRKLYRRIADPEISTQIDWRAVHVFWGDERCVPAVDSSSNYRMAREVLLDLVPIPNANVHPIDGTLDPADAATRYIDDLGDEPLDLVLLGMGGDGHTASLFPSTPNLENELRSVIATESPVPPVDRVSLSLRAINAARAIAFLVTGPGKAARLAEVLSPSMRDGAALPAAMVCPEKGDLTWFIDAAAARHLSPVTSRRTIHD